MSEQKMSERTCRPSVSWRKSLGKHLENPEVRSEYEALEEETAFVPDKSYTEPEMNGGIGVKR